jgi:hypothetical protein
MDNAGAPILDKVYNLSDLELATLTCFVAEQHCIIQTSEDLLDHVEQELAIVGLTYVVRKHPG